MLKLKKIAITGGIASGKTTVSRILKEHGACTLNSDEIIHKLLDEDSVCIQKVIELLGEEIESQGKIDREKVAQIVFNDEKKLKALEALLHPPLFKRIEEEHEKAKRDGKSQYFVVELPLVQELGKEKEFDLVIAVVSNEDDALERFTQAGFTKENFFKRKKYQWNPKKKAENAHYVINNQGTITDLKNNVLEIIKEIDSQ